MYAVKDYSVIHGEKCWQSIEKIAPCENACPAGVNIPGFIMALAKGEVAESLRIIQDSLPLAGTLGRICHHPCEDACNRGVIDDPLGVMRLKRHAYDFGKPDEDAENMEKPEGEKVAIVGSGPAGLSAGYFLNRLGYRVTIFEAESTPGGMPANAIPEFILPLQVVRSEIDTLQRIGLEFKVGTKIGKHIGFEDIWHKGYKAILVSTGTQKSRMLEVPGHELNGIVPAVPFLKSARSGRMKSFRGRVVVIGGGNVAVDAARVALRLGASQVDLACLESRDQMPAFSWEVEECEKEGVIVHNALAPQAFLPLGQSTNINRVHFQRVKTLKVDQEGELTWELAEGPAAEVGLEANTVIVAIGQFPDLGFLEEVNLETDKRGALLVEKDTLMTSYPGIFSAGDAVSGGGKAVEAVATGKKAAASISAFIRGRRPLDWQASEGLQEIFKLEKKMVPSFFRARRRWEEVRIPLQNRVRGFEEIDLGYTAKQVTEEARRCLNCKMCGSCIFEMGQICFDQASRMLM